MNRRIFNSILKQIVIDFPYAECGRLNSFLTVTNGHQSFSDTWGQTINDYRDGMFYSRSWVEGGANQNDLHIDYVLLASESNKGDIQKKNDSIVSTDEFWITLVDLMDCPDADCSGNKQGCNRSNFQIEQNLRCLVHYILSELFNYNEFQALEDFGELKEGETYWLSKARRDSIPAGKVKCIGSVQRYVVPTQQINISTMDPIAINNKVGVTFMLKVKGCDVCEGTIATDPIIPVDCEPVQVFDTANNLLGSALFPDTFTVQDVLIRNSDSSWTENALAESTFVVPDNEVVVNVDGVEVLNESVPYNTSATFNIDL